MSRKEYPACCCIVFGNIRTTSSVVGGILMIVAGCIGETNPDATIHMFVATILLSVFGIFGAAGFADSMNQSDISYGDHGNGEVWIWKAGACYCVVAITLMVIVGEHESLQVEMPVWAFLLTLGVHHMLPELYVCIFFIMVGAAAAAAAAAICACILPFYIIFMIAKGMQHLCLHGFSCACPCGRNKVTPAEPKSEPKPEPNPEPNPIPDHRRPEFTPIPPSVLLEHAAVDPEPSAPPPPPPPPPDPPVYDIEAPPPPYFQPSAPPATHSGAACGLCNCPFYTDPATHGSAHCVHKYHTVCLKSWRTSHTDGPDCPACPLA